MPASVAGEEDWRWKSPAEGLTKRGSLVRLWLAPKFWSTPVVLIYAPLLLIEMLFRIAVFWAFILHPAKTAGFGTAYPVADTKGGQPCTAGSGTPEPTRCSSSKA